MSAPVDVLALLEEYAGIMDGVLQQENAAELREARSAVAKLIDATSDLIEESLHPYDLAPYEDGEWPALDAARAALARVTGEQA